MDYVVTSHMRDELRREAAIHRLTALLSTYRTIDLEAFVDLLVQQHKAIQAACDSANGSLIDALYNE